MNPASPAFGASLQQCFFVRLRTYVFYHAAYCHFGKLIIAGFLFTSNVSYGVACVGGKGRCAWYLIPNLIAGVGLYFCRLFFLDGATSLLCTFPGEEPLLGIKPKPLLMLAYS
jgi:hypothetical protein